MIEELRSVLLRHVPSVSIASTNGNGLTVEWAQVPGKLFSVQCSLMKALSTDDWFLDVEDVPEELAALQLGHGGLGTLLRVSRSSLTPDLFRELGRQVWLGLAGSSAQPSINSWTPGDLFKHTDRFLGLVQRAHSKVGIVSYFDSESWLIAGGP